MDQRDADAWTVRCVRSALDDDLKTQYEIRRHVEFTIKATALTVRSSYCGVSMPEALFTRAFSREAGWKALRAFDSSDGIGTFVARGWVLKQMEAVSGPRRCVWKAHDGEEPLKWLCELGEGEKVRLRGQRDIYLDSTGEVHELTRSGGLILAPGVAEWQGAENGMSQMEIRSMLRVLQDRQAATKGNDQELLRVPLRTKLDVGRLWEAVKIKDTRIVELSEDGVLLPEGVEFGFIESAALAARQSDLGEFLARVDGKGGEELLPATAVVVVGHARQRRLPEDPKMLALHFLVLARVHGFNPSRADATKVLKSLTAGTARGERDALRRLVNGKSPHNTRSRDLGLHCPRGHGMGRGAATGLIAALLHKTFECSGCYQQLPEETDHHSCLGGRNEALARPSRASSPPQEQDPPCDFHLCEECAQRVVEFKEQLR